MALTSAERIEISKKIIEIPLQNAAFDSVKATMVAAKVDLTNEDNANKSLMDTETALVNAYQSEFTNLDGNVRTVLLEQDVIDGANRIFQNFFFPNDNLTVLPNVPDGVWKFLSPFSGSVAIGKDYLEAIPSTTVLEQDKIDDINTEITTIESEPQPHQSTGKECINGGFCTGESSPPQVTEGACTGDGGSWTPGADTYANETVIQTALTDITTNINAWRSFLVTEKAFIPTADTDAGRQAQNDTAIADIDNVISIIDTWLALDDWDTTTSLPTGDDGAGCALYDALDNTDFAASKLRSNELAAIKTEITARQSFITTRESQLTTNLGAVGQNLATGEINGTGTGLYDSRFKAINVRLNLLGGSLNRKLSNERGQDAQDDMKDTNDAASALYNAAMKATKFRAPAANTGTIHVMDASLFSASDTVFVVADKQTELTGTISSIVNNTVFLDFTIPEKYTHENNGRLYKVL
jgi:hypothetical protein